MRKFTLLIASLFLALGAMAQNATTHEDGAYKIFWQWNGRGYLTYHADYPNDPQLAGVTLSGYQNSHYALSDAGIQLSWYLYTSPKTGKSYLFEATTGKFITINTGVSVGNGKKCTLSTEVTAQAQFDLKATTNTAGYMLSYGNYNFCSGCGSAKGNNPVRFASDGQTDGGIPFVFVSEGASITDEVKNAAIAKIKAFEGVDASYKLIDQAGNIYEGNFTYNGSNTPGISGAYGYSLTSAEWDETKLLYTATINFAYPVSKVGGATNETLLSQFDSGKFWHADGNSVKVQTVGVKAIDANCLWAIYPSFNNGAFKFAIMNVATGKYIHTDATAAAHNTENTITLSDTPTMFTIASEKDWKVDGKNLYISINSSGDTNVWLGVYGNAHGGTNVTPIELPQYEVAVTAAKYATFYAPVAVTVPTGVTAHTVTINGEWASLSEALTVIPAYTGVVLYSETAATYTFAVTNEQVAPVENNVLEGTVAATYVTANAYVLGVKDGEVGFYAATTEGQAQGTFLNNHHKAYLPASAANNAASYSFRFDGEGTTGIDEVVVENAVEGIYDLTGRKIDTITKAGIYIVNGKKVLVK